MKSAISTTEGEARAIEAKLDAACGYPRWEQGEIGPPVWTERYTESIQLEDGTWATQMADVVRTTAKVAMPTATRDLATLRKREPIDDVKPVDPKADAPVDPKAPVLVVKR